MEIPHHHYKTATNEALRLANETGKPYAVMNGSLNGYLGYLVLPQQEADKERTIRVFNKE